MVTPAERGSTRPLWRRGTVITVASIIGLLVLIVCCGGGLARAHRGWGSQRSDEARTALARYLDDMKAGDSAAAYRLLCADVLFGYTESDHATFLAAQPKISSYQIGDPLGDQGLGSTYLEFPVTVTYQDGSSAVVRFETENDRGSVTVCDGRGWRT